MRRSRLLTVSLAATAVIAGGLLSPVAAGASPTTAPAPPARSWVLWHEQPLPATAVPGSLLAASTGLVWYFDFDSGLVTSFDPAIGTVHAEPASAGNAPLELVEGADGTIWWSDFTSGALRRLDPTTGRVDDLVLVPALHPIRGGVASDGSLWWGTDDPGTLLHISLTGTLTQVSVPWGSEIGDVAEGSDGRLWMIANGGSTVAAFDPVGGGFTEYPIGASWTTSLDLGTDGAVWIPDGDSLLRVDTAGAPVRIAVPDGEYVSDIAPGGPGVILLDSANRMHAVGSTGFTPLGTGAPGATARSLSVSPSGVTWYADPLRATLGNG